MVDQFAIGVLGIQGAISEHVQMMKQVMNNHNNASRVPIVRKKSDLDEISGLIIPGGESTTISRFLLQNDLNKIIKNRADEQSLSVMGTCAGCILVASDIVEKSKDITLLSLMDMKVQRNAFGRQRESFEHYLPIQGVSDAFPAVFIRAPLILKTWGRCISLATLHEKMVMARQENVLALSFHPELTYNLSVHEFFYNIVSSYRK